MTDTVSVPIEVLRELVRIAQHVSLGRSAASTQDPPYPDAAARRALGALSDAGTLAVLDGSAPADQTADETDCCGSEPPPVIVDKDGNEWQPGDCWCTLPQDHEGDCLCGPCAERYGAPGWHASAKPTFDMRQRIYDLLNADGDFIGCPTTMADRIAVNVVWPEFQRLDDELFEAQNRSSTRYADLAEIRAVLVASGVLPPPADTSLPDVGDTLAGARRLQAEMDRLRGELERAKQAIPACQCCTFGDHTEACECLGVLTCCHPETHTTA